VCVCVRVCVSPSFPLSTQAFPGTCAGAGATRRPPPDCPCSQPRLALPLLSDLDRTAGQAAPLLLLLLPLLLLLLLLLLLPPPSQRPELPCLRAQVRGFAPSTRPRTGPPGPRCFATVGARCRCSALGPVVARPPTWCVCVCVCVCGCECVYAQRVSHARTGSHAHSFTLWSPTPAAKPERSLSHRVHTIHTRILHT